MQEKLLSVVATINSYLTDYVLILLLIGLGLFFTIATRFVQIRYFGAGMKAVFGKLKLKGAKADKGGMSSFQALATAIAAQVGTGNIVGACGAILVGGPGAIFWMWIIAFFGMATIYAEATLAQKTKITTDDGRVLGGPVYYIKTAFKGAFGKFLAVFFSIATILALGFMGCAVQANSIGGAFETAFHIPTWITGIIVAAIAGTIFIGGVKALASVTEKLVPIMAGLYIVGCLALLVINITKLPETIVMIFKYAFAPSALAGGAFGATIKTAISQGAKRGLFSNEAGMGSTPHAHALAKVDHPHDQGIVAMMGVFIDTFVVLNLTAFVVISSLYTEGGLLANGPAEGISKANMAQLSFEGGFGSLIGPAFVAICLLFFAFSTILSWNMFGELNVRSLLGKKFVLPYSIIAIVCVFLGSIASNDLVWELTDFFNYLMVLPNAIALFACAKMVIGSVKEIDTKKKQK